MSSYDEYYVILKIFLIWGFAGFYAFSSVTVSAKLARFALMYRRGGNDYST